MLHTEGMNLLRTTRAKVAAGAVAAAVMMGVGATIALAASDAASTAAGASPAGATAPAGATTPAGAPTPAAGGASIAAFSAAAGPSPATPAHPRRRLGAARAAGFMRSADHATVEVKRHGAWVTLTFDRGKVTAASASSITLLRPDGRSTTIALSASTRYRGVTSASGLVTGRPAVVISEGGTAIWVAQPTKAPTKARFHAPTTAPGQASKAPATTAS